MLPFPFDFAFCPFCVTAFTPAFALSEGIDYAVVVVEVVVVSFVLVTVVVLFVAFALVFIVLFPYDSNVPVVGVLLVEVGLKSLVCDVLSELEHCLIEDFFLLFFLFSITGVQCSLPALLFGRIDQLYWS